jgi:hypothetical protein
MLLFSIQYRRFVGFATGAEFAFEWALKNYCKPNDVLHLLHVRHATDDFGINPKWRVPADVASEVEQKMEVAAQALLQTFLDRATLAKVNFSLSFSSSCTSLCL